MVMGGEGTNYTCEYNNNDRFIINLESEQSFTIDGGILKYGNLNYSNINSIYFYFIFMRGINLFFKMRHIEIKFMVESNSLIYIYGGIISVEHVKIKNNISGWVYPLVYVFWNTSSVIVELFSVNVVECYFKSREVILVYFHLYYSYFHPIFLNVSSFYCQDSFFNSTEGLFCFYSNHGSSCFYLFIYVLFLIFIIFLGFSFADSLFMNISTDIIYGGFFFFFREIFL
jgi:hypothetical protein